MIYISTGGFRAVSGAEMALNFSEHGIFSVELSGGAYESNQEERLKSIKNTLALQIHNYFPPPKDPFVFNLAAIDSKVLERSINHVRSGIKLCTEIDRPIYSFHGGYLVNPRPNELGGAFKKYYVQERRLALKQFGDVVVNLAEEARREGVQLLIENNVLSFDNLKVFGEDPFLFTEPDEINEFMQSMPKNVGLLMDVAHLNVTAASLGFDKVEAHKAVEKWIRGYHLSDNNGKVDSNNAVCEGSWFWPHILNNLYYYTLEVYGVGPQQLYDQLELTKKMITNNQIKSN